MVAILGSLATPNHHSDVADEDNDPQRSFGVADLLSSHIPMEKLPAGWWCNSHLEK